jgi:hypothetical protein
MKFERNSAPPPRFPSSMLGQQKPDVWMRGANIETDGGREGGKIVSGNGILQPMHVKTRLSQSILSKIVC